MEAEGVGIHTTLLAVFVKKAQRLMIVRPMRVSELGQPAEDRGCSVHEGGAGLGIAHVHLARVDLLRPSGP